MTATHASRHIFGSALLLASFAFGLAAQAGDQTSRSAGSSARWQATKIEIRDKNNTVFLPRFAPDSRLLAYAVTVPSGDMNFAEIRRYAFADGKTKVLLPLGETRKMADYGAYPFEIRWNGPDALQADVSNGDDGYNRYMLKAERTGSLSIRSFEAGEENRPTKPDPALRALVPDWPAPVFENAMQYMVRIRAHGALVQKHYADQDDHLWWLDLGDRKARIALAEPGDAKQELMDGFAFGDYAVFALRIGNTVTAQRLDGDGRLQEIEGSRVQTDADPDAINTTTGGLDNRRCSESVCWGAYRIHRDDRTETRVLRLDRQGRAELLAPIAGLEDFDVSPDYKRLAAAVMRGGKRTILVFDILAF